MRIMKIDWMTKRKRKLTEENGRNNNYKEKLKKKTKVNDKKIENS